MLGNFTFHNPTRVHFGDESLNKLSEELKAYGPKVLLAYGGGSIKRNGVYDAVMAELKKAGKQVVEISGVMPNPTIDKVMEGVELVRKEKGRLHPRRGRRFHRGLLQGRLRLRLL